MNLRNKLKEDSVTALKAHDAKRVEVLRFLISLIDKKEMQLPPETMKEEDEVGVLRKELKNKEESRAMFEKAGRNDLVEEVNAEILIVNEYLPKQMEESEITEIVKAELKTNPNANFGMLMGATMKKVAGKAGGDVVGKVVKEVLGQ